MNKFGPGDGDGAIFGPKYAENARICSPATAGYGNFIVHVMSNEQLTQ
jgi:hypothetical protein